MLRPRALSHFKLIGRHILDEVDLQFYFIRICFPYLSQIARDSRPGIWITDRKTGFHFNYIIIIII